MVAFTYRPKFVDIRVCKPEPGVDPRRVGEPACDHIGCKEAGRHKAPKPRTFPNEYWRFCAAHASEYNRNYNFFEGMSPGEYEAFAKSAAYGHRQTWDFKASPNDRESAARRKFHAFRKEKDGLGDGPNTRRPAVAKAHRDALQTLGLQNDASPDEIRSRYADLVKRYHPDSNGGDRSAESLLSKVVKAYQSLKHGGFTRDR